jgi:hypothetical protein
MILCLALVAGPVMSHEFWLEPLAYQIEPGRRLTAELINGELFAGDKVPFIPQRIVSYVVFAGDKSARVSMRVGDTPGLQQAALGEGLHVVAYQSIVATLDYPEWGKFQSFASHKDLGDLLKRHTARSLPASNFVEAYSRYSKTLIGVAVRRKGVPDVAQAAGTECSQKPSTYPSIYTLLPSPLRHAPAKGAVQGVQAVGRLDQDTTGLLLLTDDGKFIHRMSSPRHHVPKVYEVTTKHALDDTQVRRCWKAWCWTTTRNRWRPPPARPWPATSCA